MHDDSVCELKAFFFPLSSLQTYASQGTKIIIANAE